MIDETTKPTKSRWKRRIILAVTATAIPVLAPSPDEKTWSSSVGRGGGVDYVNQENRGGRRGLGWPAKTLYRNVASFEIERREGDVIRRFKFDLPEFQRLNDGEFLAKYGVEKSEVGPIASWQLDNGWEFNPGPIVLFGSASLLLFIAIPFLRDQRRESRERLTATATDRGYTPALLAAIADQVSQRIVAQAPRKTGWATILALVPMMIPASPVESPVSGYYSVSSGQSSTYLQVAARRTGVGWPWRTVSHSKLIVTLYTPTGATAGTRMLDYDAYHRLDADSFKARYGVAKPDINFDTGPTSSWKFNFWPILLFHPLSYLFVVRLTTAIQWRRIWWRVVEGRCLNCGYSLFANRSERCPECGRNTALDAVEIWRSEARADTHPVEARKMTAQQD